MLDALYPGFESRSRHIQLSDALWAEVAFRQSALGSSSHLWLGVRQSMLDTKEVRIEQNNFELHVFLF